MVSVFKELSPKNWYKDTAFNALNISIILTNKTYNKKYSLFEIRSIQQLDAINSNKKELTNKLNREKTIKV